MLHTYRAMTAAVCWPMTLTSSHSSHFGGMHLGYKMGTYAILQIFLTDLVLINVHRVGVRNLVTTVRNRIVLPGFLFCLSGQYVQNYNKNLIKAVVYGWAKRNETGCCIF